MPTAPARLCPNCGARVHGRCTCTTSTTTTNTGWTARKPKSWAGGSTRAWREFRAAWLAEHPMCMEPECNELAIVVCHKPGTDYDHDRCNPNAIEGQRCKTHDAQVTGRQGGAASGRSRRRTPTR